MSNSFFKAFNEATKRAMDTKSPMTQEEKLKFQNEVLGLVQKEGWKPITREEAQKIGLSHAVVEADNPYWVYKYWNWSAWSLANQDFWIKKWRESHPQSQEALYALLLENQGDYYYINNFLSNHRDQGEYSYTNIPDPANKANQMDPSMLKYFYERLVPYAGAFVVWFRQMDENLIYGPDLTTIKWKLNTTAPGVWFQIKKDQLTTDVSNALGGAGGIGFTGGILLAGAVGVGLIYASRQI